MKHLIIALATLASLTASAQLGVDAMAQQRARNAANQTTARSGQTSAAAPAPATPVHAVATPLTPGQQAYATFQSELFAMNTNSSPADKQDLARDLGKVAQGANKPTAATLSKLTDDLTTALSEAKLTPQRKTRLAQTVAVLLNSANTSPVQKQAMIKDVESILQMAGASGEHAAAVTADLQTVTDEVKPK
jgi:hypothetical protein